MAARKFPANSHRHDPYRNFKFQVVIEWRTGGDPSHIRKDPVRADYT